MRRISFNPRFVNKTGDDLIPGKIHTIRQNFHYWAKFEGRDVELFTWEGKPYRSKQKVFCVKRLVHVQPTVFDKKRKQFWISTLNHSDYLQSEIIAHNDGFDTVISFDDWFKDYPTDILAILHFTDFQYGA